jgi:steroid delta-isomerase
MPYSLGFIDRAVVEIAAVRGNQLLLCTPEKKVAAMTCQTESLVRKYYETVDRGDVRSLLWLFDPEALYRRPGYPDLRGRPDLERFYREQRVISSGRHTIERLLIDRLSAAVYGRFHGLLRSGEDIELRFADFFELSEAGMITHRDTFFFAPMV